MLGEEHTQGGEDVLGRLRRYDDPQSTFSRESCKLSLAGDRQDGLGGLEVLEGLGREV
jgi:hypothetical protein